MSSARSPRHLVLALLVGCVCGAGPGGLAPPTAGPAAAATTFPAKNTVLFPGLTGTVLQDSLRLRYRPPQTWSYNTARDTMYARIDNHGGTVSCIYTGFTIAANPNSASIRADVFAAGINAEHTWPQSKGADRPPMEADLHHLFPSEIRANADRGNLPFSEIPDEQTDKWYRLTQITTTPEIELIEQYSELDTSFPGTAYAGRWEPREDRAGDVARAQFYFWTVYRAEATAGDPNFFDAEKNSLRAWAQEDPVDDREYARTIAIAPHEGDKVNPFVIDPTLVDRAYFSEVPVDLAYFNVEAADDGVRLAWRTTAELDHAGFNVLRVERGRETRLNTRLIAAGTPYGWLDRQGRPGAWYDYWIEAVGRDGSVERYGPRGARFPELAPAVSVWPNPVRAGAPLHVRSAGAAPSRAALFDVGGRRVTGAGAVFEALGGGWTGVASAPLDVAPGVYFLRVTGEGGRGRTVRLVVVP